LAKAATWQTWGAAGGYLGTAVGVGASALGGLLAIKGVAGTVMETLNLTGQVAGTAGAAISSAMSAAAQSVALVTHTAQQVVGVLLSVPEVATSALSAIQSLAEGIQTQLGEAFQFLTIGSEELGDFGYFASYISRGMRAAAGLITAQIVAATQPLATVASLLGGIATKMGDIVELAATAAARVAGLAGSVATGISRIVQQASSVLLGIGTYIAGVIALFTNFISSIARVFGAISGLVSSIGATLERLAKAGADATKRMTAMISTIAGGVTGIISALMPALTTGLLLHVAIIVARNFATIAQPFLTTVGRYISPVTLTLAGIVMLLGPVIGQIGEALSQVLGIVGQVVGGVLKMVGAFAEAVSRAFGALTQITIRYVQGLVGALTGLWQTLGATAARAETVGVALTVMGANAGLARDRILGLWKDLQKQNIAMIESGQSMALLLSRYPALINWTEKLGEAAKDWAVISGFPTAHVFQAFSTAVTRANMAMLEHLNIVYPASLAYQIFASRIGLAAEGLSNFLRSVAVASFLTDVLGRRVKGVYEATYDSLGKLLTSMQRVFQTLRIELGAQLLPAFNLIGKTLHAIAEGIPKWEGVKILFRGIGEGISRGIMDVFGAGPFGKHPDENIVAQTLRNVIESPEFLRAAGFISLVVERAVAQVVRVLLNALQNLPQILMRLATYWRMFITFLQIAWSMLRRFIQALLGVGPAARAAGEGVLGMGGSMLATTGILGRISMGLIRFGMTLVRVGEVLEKWSQAAPSVFLAAVDLILHGIGAMLKGLSDFIGALPQMMRMTHQFFLQLLETAKFLVNVFIPLMISLITVQTAASGALIGAALGGPVGAKIGLGAGIVVGGAISGYLWYQLNKVKGLLSSAIAEWETRGEDITKFEKKVEGLRKSLESMAFAFAPGIFKEKPPKEVDLDIFLSTYDKITRLRQAAQALGNLTASALSSLSNLAKEMGDEFLKAGLDVEALRQDLVRMYLEAQKVAAELARDLKTLESGIREFPVQQVKIFWSPIPVEGYRNAADYLQACYRYSTLTAGSLAESLGYLWAQLQVQMNMVALTLVNLYGWRDTVKGIHTATEEIGTVYELHKMVGEQLATAAQLLKEIFETYDKLLQLIRKLAEASASWARNLHPIAELTAKFNLLITPLYQIYNTLQRMRSIPLLPLGEWAQLEAWQQIYERLSELVAGLYQTGENAAKAVQQVYNQLVGYWERVSKIFGDTLPYFSGMLEARLQAIRHLLEEIRLLSEIRDLYKSHTLLVYELNNAIANLIEKLLDLTRLPVLIPFGIPAEALESTFSNMVGLASQFWRVMGRGVTSFGTALSTALRPYFVSLTMMPFFRQLLGERFGIEPEGVIDLRRWVIEELQKRGIILGVEGRVEIIPGLVRTLLYPPQPEEDTLTKILGEAHQLTRNTQGARERLERVTALLQNFRDRLQSVLREIEGRFSPLEVAMRIVWEAFNVYRTYLLQFPELYTRPMEFGAALGKYILSDMPANIAIYLPRIHQTLLVIAEGVYATYLAILASIQRVTGKVDTAQLESTLRGLGQRLARDLILVFQQQVPAPQFPMGGALPQTIPPQMPTQQQIPQIVPQIQQQLFPPAAPPQMPTVMPQIGGGVPPAQQAIPQTIPPEPRQATPPTTQQTILQVLRAIQAIPPEVQQAVQAVPPKALQTIQQAIQTILPTTQQAIQAIQATLPATRQAIQTIPPAVQQVILQAAQQVVQAATPEVQQAIQQAIQAIPPGTRQAIQRAIQAALPAIQQAIQQAVPPATQQAIQQATQQAVLPELQQAAQQAVARPAPSTLVEGLMRAGWQAAVRSVLQVLFPFMPPSLVGAIARPLTMSAVQPAAPGAPAAPPLPRTPQEFAMRFADIYRRLENLMDVIDRAKPAEAVDIFFDNIRELSRELEALYPVAEQLKGEAGEVQRIFTTAVRQLAGGGIATEYTQLHFGRVGSFREWLNTLKGVIERALSAFGAGQKFGEEYVGGVLLSLAYELAHMPFSEALAQLVSRVFAQFARKFIGGEALWYSTLTKEKTELMADSVRTFLRSFDYILGEWMEGRAARQEQIEPFAYSIEREIRGYQDLTRRALHALRIWRGYSPQALGIVWDKELLSNLQQELLEAETRFKEFERFAREAWLGVRRSPFANLPLRIRQDFGQHFEILSANFRDLAHGIDEATSTLKGYERLPYELVVRALRQLSTTVENVARLIGGTFRGEARELLRRGVPQLGALLPTTPQAASLLFSLPAIYGLSTFLGAGLPLSVDRVPKGIYLHERGGVMPPIEIAIELNVDGEVIARRIVRTNIFQRGVRGVILSDLGVPGSLPI